MLDKLRGYAESTHLIINTSKSEVVHVNSRGEQPKLKVGGTVLQCKDSFKYLGMMFYKTLNMERSSELSCTIRRIGPPIRRNRNNTPYFVSYPVRPEQQMAGRPETWSFEL